MTTQPAQAPAVDAYLSGLLAPEDPALSEALAAGEAHGLPQIAVTATGGKLLHLLARLRGARRALEIGTLGGYSTIWLARALPEDGTLVSLEYNQKHAEVARANVARAGLDKVVDIRVGPALDSLPQVAADHADNPFDLVFIDADKANNAHYLEWALRLTRPGSVIVIDNVVREGRILDAQNTEPDVVGTRGALELLAEHPKLDATAIQTVGAKGWDGMAIALVRD
ncbi:O-methyltransferase [Streptomyces beihaiensis]|uniref:O-methyltransferase n=1 Tax=Streptomyces beihaiensis TaxID=2984495 RepID=A0ABT3TUW2_9ACTN|nr:O-methyltransferase [Streptomyces beihaiensis]MCX3060832.1 O-methyltransferase [Streptomyces beihaiensis]